MTMKGSLLCFALALTLIMAIAIANANANANADSRATSATSATVVRAVNVIQSARTWLSNNRLPSLPIPSGQASQYVSSNSGQADISSNYVQSNVQSNLEALRRRECEKAGLCCTSPFGDRLGENPGKGLQQVSVRQTDGAECALTVMFN